MATTPTGPMSPDQLQGQANTGMDAARAGFYAQHPDMPGGSQYQQGPETPGSGGYGAWATPTRVDGSAWTPEQMQSAGMGGPPPGYEMDPASGMYRFHNGNYTSFFNPANGQYSANSGGTNTELGQYDWRPLVNAEQSAVNGAVGNYQASFQQPQMGAQPGMAPRVQAQGMAPRPGFPPMMGGMPQGQPRMGAMMGGPQGMGMMGPGMGMFPPQGNPFQSSGPFAPQGFQMPSYGFQDNPFLQFGYGAMSNMGNAVSPYMGALSQLMAPALNATNFNPWGMGMGALGGAMGNMRGTLNPYSGAMTNIIGGVGNGIGNILNSFQPQMYQPRMPQSPYGYGAPQGSGGYGSPGGLGQLFGQQPPFGGGGMGSSSGGFASPPQQVFAAQQMASPPLSISQQSMEHSEGGLSNGNMGNGLPSGGELPPLDQGMGGYQYQPGVPNPSSYFPGSLYQPDQNGQINADIRDPSVRAYFGLGAAAPTPWAQWPSYATGSFNVGQTGPAQVPVGGAVLPAEVAARARAYAAAGLPLAVAARLALHQTPGVSRMPGYEDGTMDTATLPTGKSVLGDPNTPAILHQGEMVLDPSSAGQVRSDPSLPSSGSVYQGNSAQEVSMNPYGSALSTGGGASPGLSLAKQPPPMNVSPLSYGLAPYAGGGSIPNPDLGGAQTAPSRPSDPTQSYMSALPAPSQINPNAWMRLDPDTQQFLLGAYESAGYSAPDVLWTIQQLLPGRAAGWSTQNMGAYGQMRA